MEKTKFEIFDEMKLMQIGHFFMWVLEYRVMTCMAHADFLVRLCISANCHLYLRTVNCV